MLPQCVVDPVLDTARVQTIIVVMAAAVAATIAHVGGKYIPTGHGWTGIQENAATRVAGANVAGYGPERLSLIDDSSQCRNPDAPLPVPHLRDRGARGCVSPPHLGAVTHDGHLHSFGSVERAGRGEARRLDTGGLVCEED